MADKLEGGVVGGSTSLSVRFRLLKTADGTEQTGKVAADMVGSYWRQGGLRVVISLSDLGAVDSAYSSGGVKEVDATNMPGTYRLDLPNAAIAAGVDSVTVTIKVAGCFLAELWIPITTYGTLALQVLLAAVKTKTDNLPSAIRKNQSQLWLFFMRQSADLVSPATGLTVTAQRSLDGAVFAACVNGVSEIGFGWYSIVLHANDTNADVVGLKFTATGAVPLNERFFTKAA